MPFNPSPGQTLDIDGIVYRIAEHPNAPGMPYGQEGRQAVVYQLLSETGAKALKVFKPRYRNPSLFMLAENIEKYAVMPGLQVCRRVVLSPQKDYTLLQQFPELTYAVLMPWVDGQTWMEILQTKTGLTPQQSLVLGRTLADILSRLEQNGMAHCDISGANLILPGSASSPRSELVELVDVEGLFAPGLPRPDVLPAGSLGYAHKAAPDGLWSPQADRFAGGLLLAEMLAWCDEQVRQAAYGESYFNPRELQQPGARFQLLEQRLEARWGSGVASLLRRVWQSAAPSECPTMGEWVVTLPQQVPAYANLASVLEAVEVDQQETGQHQSVVKNLLEIARKFEEQGKLENAGEIYRQALALCAPGSGLETEIQLLVKQIEVRITELARNEPAELAAKDSMRSGGSWRCPDCGRLVSRELQVCPYCEGGQVKEEMRHPPQPKPKRLPLWGWAVLWMSVLGVIFFMLVGSVSLVSQGQKGLGPLAFLATDTPTPTATPIATATPELRIGSTPTATPIAIATPELRVGSTQVSPKDGMLMVYVPAGDFLMGSEDRKSDEKPQHRVYLDAYWIDQTEVTNGMYAQCVADGVCEPPQEIKSYTRSNYYNDNQYADYPVVYVDWNQANAYCGWAGRRLPTEAEWEKAARGTAGRTYPWGEGIDCDKANYNDCGVGDTTAVGSYLQGASEYGALDMAGNVWEWVADWYSETYYIGSPSENPQGPASGESRVLRGGSWYAGSWCVRASYRNWDDPGNWVNGDGFRCVLTLDKRPDRSQQ